MVRAPHFDKNGVKKGAWSAEEDDKLRSYIQRNGGQKWRELPKLAGLQRCGNSCRLRWMNYLRPNVKLGSYTKEEEDLIMKSLGKHGKKWSKIADGLPGRTDNEIKNHWRTHLKKRTMSQEAGLQSSEADSHTQNSSGKSEANTSIICDVPLNLIILESSLLSPKEASPSGFSSNNTSICESLIDTNCNTAAGGDSLGSILEMCRELTSAGEFWTEPFVTDKRYNNQSHQSCFEGGFLSPYYDDDLDLLYQVMNELPNPY